MQKLSWNFHEFTFSIINYIFKSKFDFFLFYFLFFLNFNYDSFNYLFLPACCAPHAGLGIKQFFFTICQENFRICQENRGISGSVQKNFQIYLRFLIANFRILTYRHLATYRKQTKKNTRLQVILTSKFCLIW